MTAYEIITTVCAIIGTIYIMAIYGELHHRGGAK